MEKSTPVAKEVEGVSPLAKRAAMKTASKYKYNSLKEYNDGLTRRTIDELSDSNHVGGGLSDDALESLYQERKSSIRANLAKADEEAYNQSKFLNKEFGYDPVSGGKLDDVLNEFSPQAKAEMKAFKALVNSNNRNRPNWFGEGEGIVDWTDELDNYANWLRVDEVPF